VVEEELGTRKNPSLEFQEEERGKSACGEKQATLGLYIDEIETPN